MNAEAEFIVRQFRSREDDRQAIFKLYDLMREVLDDSTARADDREVGADVLDHAAVHLFRHHASAGLGQVIDAGVKKRRESEGSRE